MTLTPEPMFLTSTQTASPPTSVRESVCFCLRQKERAAKQTGVPALAVALGGRLGVGVRGHEFKEIPSVVPRTYRTWNIKKN